MAIESAADAGRKGSQPENPAPSKPNIPGPVNPDPIPEEPEQDIREVELPPTPHGPNKIVS